MNSFLILIPMIAFSTFKADLLNQASELTSVAANVPNRSILTRDVIVSFLHGSRNLLKSFC